MKKKRRERMENAWNDVNCMWMYDDESEVLSDGWISWFGWWRGYRRLQWNSNYPTLGVGVCCVCIGVLMHGRGRGSALVTILVANSSDSDRLRLLLHFYFDRRDSSKWNVLHLTILGDALYTNKYNTAMFLFLSVWTWVHIFVYVCMYACC